MENQKPSRREFCVHAASFVTLASLVEGCGGGNGNPTNPGGGAGTPALPTINATAASGSIRIENVGASALANVGSAALIQTSAGNFLVVRTAQNSFNALTAVCTHEQCVVSGFSSGTFTCPCHGSQYSSGGAVTRGPATRALQTFSTAFTNDVLTITT
jgi:cytochrome b6-f complex iron-sulfur subunit